MNAVLGFTDLAIQAGNDTAKIQDYLKKSGFREIIFLEL